MEVEVDNQEHFSTEEDHRRDEMIVSQPAKHVVSKYSYVNDMNGFFATNA